ncbi:MAG: transcription antitermination factor NusB [Clostridia bacterium]|nr:transcription antitermination factor NusB [Clostridia bacterium]
MSRKTARESVFKMIFEYTFSKEKNNDMLEEMISADENKAEIGYIKEVYNGVIQNYDELIEKIASVSQSFKLDRIYKIDLAILLVALYEILYVKSIPTNVSINEALNLSKAYSTEKSASFINGILSNFVGE